MRYQDFPDAQDIQDDLTFWGHTRDGLHVKTRAIWTAGFQTMKDTPAKPVGSGFDTSDSEA